MGYECTFICSPELDTAKVEEITAKVSKIVETSGGTIKNLQQLGKKKLAYNVKKFREGIYVYMELDGNGSMVSTLETFFKVNDPIIRFLTIKVEPKKKLAKKADKKAKVAEKTETTNEPTELPTTTAE
ncbi:MAG: 30S ribosomal protein S6 [Endomicrobiaceae bacterium]|nr:30S ribosomal protein S6 [Endomicrobiaceae bacterium]